MSTELLSRWQKLGERLLETADLHSVVESLEELIKETSRTTSLPKVSQETLTFQHTPGPWEMCTGSHKDSCICGLVYSKTPQKYIAGVHMERCPLETHGEMAPPDEESKANIRLIISAPDLLKACWKAARVIELMTQAGMGNHTLSSLHELLQETIRKASGEVREGQP
jgi:hypothetical protein